MAQQRCTVSCSHPNGRPDRRSARASGKSALTSPPGQSTDRPFGRPALMPCARPGDRSPNAHVHRVDGAQETSSVSITVRSRQRHPRREASSQSQGSLTRQPSHRRRHQCSRTPAGNRLVVWPSCSALLVALPGRSCRPPARARTLRPTAPSAVVPAALQGRRRPRQPRRPPPRHAGARAARLPARLRRTRRRLPGQPQPPFRTPAAPFRSPSTTSRSRGARCPSRRVSAPIYHRPPALKANGERLDWNRRRHAPPRYVIVGEVPGVGNRYSVVHGKSTTPPPVPGVTVTYLVRTAERSSRWSNPVKVSYPAAPTAPTPDASERRATKN